MLLGKYSNGIGITEEVETLKELCCLFSRCTDITETRRATTHQTPPSMGRDGFR